MGLFKKKREPETHWLVEIENFANYYGDLKLDMDSMVEQALDGNYDVATYLWDEKWGDYEKGCAMFFVLGVLEGVYKEISALNEEGEWDE